MMAKKVVDEYKDNLPMLKLIRKFADESINKYELNSKTNRLNKLLGTTCYEIIEECGFEDVQNNASEYNIKINNVVEWSNLTIEKHYTYDKLRGTILDDIKVKVDGIIIIDDYDNKTYTYVPNNTNETTLEKNNFASKENLIKILKFFE
jgi:hypothetical protein